VSVTKYQVGRFGVKFNRAVNTCSVTANSAASSPILLARAMTKMPNGGTGDVGDVIMDALAPEDVFVVINSASTLADADPNLHVHVQVFC
jgi:hypothetical protein